MDNLSLRKVATLNSAADAAPYVRATELREAEQKTNRYKQRMVRALETYSAVQRGRMSLSEAMTTSDFSSLFSDILDRKLLGNFLEFPQTYEAFVKVNPDVKDFRDVTRAYLDKGDGVFNRKGERVEPEERPLADGSYSYGVDVYEAVIDLDWRDLVNDDLGALNSIPERLARGARRTIQKFVTGLYCDASGPHASQFTTTATATLGANQITGNPALSLAALKTAITLMAKQVDPGGEPIWVQNHRLVIPPALQVEAQDILGSMKSEQTASGGTSAQILHVQNWMKNSLQGPFIDPYIPVVASSANGHTSWFLFGDPSGGSRPAIEVGFLKGFSAPVLLRKQSDIQALSGAGNPELMLGDFEEGAIRFKGLMVFGGKFMEKRMAVASNGSGS